MRTPTPPFDTGTSPIAARADAWLEALSTRRSRRRFDGERCDGAALDAIERVCASFTPYHDARVTLVRAPGEGVFRGIAGSYGKVTGAPHVLIVIVGNESVAAHAHAGYLGEAAILEATALGLDTCWVGGFFRRHEVERLVPPAPNERIVAVSPVGHGTATPGLSERSMRRISGAHERKPLAVVAPGLDATWPAWARAAVAAARVAPSAMNRQPWRFRIEDGSLIVGRDTRREAPRVTRALDCGIAMLHAELGAFGEGVTGRWHDLDEGLDIARFVIAP